MPLTVSGSRVNSSSVGGPWHPADRKLMDRMEGAAYGAAAAALMPLCLSYDSLNNLATGLSEPGKRPLMVQGAFEGMAAATAALWMPATVSVGCMLGAALGFKSVRYMLESPARLLND